MKFPDRIDPAATVLRFRSRSERELYVSQGRGELQSTTDRMSAMECIPGMWGMVGLRLPKAFSANGVAPHSRATGATYHVSLQTVGGSLRMQGSAEHRQEMK
ncbi:MAG: hypothetical protein F4Z35_08455 [Dehalococcoidia bacterium]|nr:hypothetical protein [Dehalococcoidia bacterium]